MTTPVIPKRIHSLSSAVVVNLNYAALVQEFSANQTAAQHTHLCSLPLTLADPPSLITVTHALLQAEYAVGLDQVENYDQALLYYRETILSLRHVLYWESTLTARGTNLSTKKEREELKFILNKYEKRVVEIGGSSEYKYRPGCHDVSVWASDKGLRMNVSDARPIPYSMKQSSHPVFTLATQLLLSVTNGAFITTHLFIPPQLWQSNLSLPLASIKASYLDAMIPHYNCLLATSPELRYNALETLNSIIGMLQSSLSKHEDHSEKNKLWSNVSPLLKGHSFTIASNLAKEQAIASSQADLKSQRRESHLRDSYIDNIHPRRLSAGTSMPLLSSPAPPQTPPKRDTLKQKFKRLTTKPEKFVSYQTSLVTLLKTLLKVEQARKDRVRIVDKGMRDWMVEKNEEDVLENGFFEEHMAYLGGVVFGFIIGDVEVLMHSFLKSLVQK